jgi:hypothetical protein
MKLLNVKEPSPLYLLGPEAVIPELVPALVS